MQHATIFVREEVSLVPRNLPQAAEAGEWLASRSDYFIREQRAHGTHWIAD